MKKLIIMTLLLQVFGVQAQGNCLVPGYPGCTRDDFDRALQMQAQQQQQQQYQMQQQQLQQQQLQEMRRSNQLMEQQLQQQQMNNILNAPLIPMPRGY
jgi:hypothetical protein